MPSPDWRGPAKGIQSTRKADRSVDRHGQGVQAAQRPQGGVQVAGEHGGLESEGSELARATASSSPSNGETPTTGPKTSSVITRLSAGGSKSTVGDSRWTGDGMGGEGRGGRRSFPLGEG